MPTHTNSSIAKIAAAQFGAAYGYRFNGDSVELHANFQILNDNAHLLRWALQLRATPTTGIETNSSHLVAEAPLPPLAEIAGAGEPFLLTAPATPPAGSGEFNLYLVLVAKDPSQGDEVHATVTFTRPERFSQPRFTGETAYLLSGDKIHLTVASLENPRELGNLTGTLALELWALTDAYSGSSFRGTHLAGVIVGQLAGQQSWRDLAYDLAFTPPQAGRWHLALMLREWTGAGYTTRDYFNFAQPLVIEAEVPITPEPIPATPKPEPSATTRPVHKVVSVPAGKPVTASTKTKVLSTKAAKPASGVSINHATSAELAAVKGITKTAVTAIIAGRPYTTLDQLSKVKGVGTKTLAKIRSSLVL